MDPLWLTARAGGQIKDPRRKQRPPIFRILKTRKQERAGGSKATSPTLIAL